MLKLLHVKKQGLILLVLFYISTGYVRADFSRFVPASGHFFDQVDKRPKKEPGFYPNPVMSTIQLTHQEEVVRVRIISLTGRTCIDISTKVKSINLSTLSKGMYLINFEMKDGRRIARKLVKK